MYFPSKNEGRIKKVYLNNVLLQLRLMNCVDRKREHWVLLISGIRQFHDLHTCFMFLICPFCQIKIYSSVFEGNLIIINESTMSRLLWVAPKWLHTRGIWISGTYTFSVIIISYLLLSDLLSRSAVAQRLLPFRCNWTVNWEKLVRGIKNEFLEVRLSQSKIPSFGVVNSNKNM